MIHQYIREQADALAQRRLGEFQQLQEWAEYEPPRQVTNYQGPLYRGGKLIKEDQYPNKNLPDKRLRTEQVLQKQG